MRGLKPYLINTYTPAEVRIWCRLVWSETEDLNIEELDEDFYQFDIEPKNPEPTLAQTLKAFSDLAPTLLKPAPEPEFPGPAHLPPWYFYDIQSVGLEDVIDPSSYSWPDHSIDPWAVFAMHHGIAPFQPFLLSIPKPYYSGPSYYGEYDVEYYHDVVALAPIGEKQKLERWEDYLKSVELEIPWVTTPPSSF